MKFNWKKIAVEVLRIIISILSGGAGAITAINM